MVRTKKDLVRWKIGETMERECINVQDDQHRLLCGLTNTKCEKNDLFTESTDDVIKLKLAQKRNMIRLSDTKK